MLNEIKLMESIQKFNFSKQMIVITTPFNTSGFIVMIIVLFVYKIICFADVVLLLKGCIIGNLLKYIFRRKRPYIHSNMIKNYSGKEQKHITQYYSFPSGHTFASTFFALLMLNKYPTEFAINIIPILVGFSRIFLGVHYPTDIIGGMLFGFIVFKILS
jgi:undecaprenyl-diphosphatase